MQATPKKPINGYKVKKMKLQLCPIQQWIIY